MILDEIVAYLAAQSTDFTRLAGSGGNLSAGIMPDASPAPDTIATVYETGGLPVVHTFSTDGVNREFEQPRIQIVTRSTDYQTARNLADTAFKLLDGLSDTTLSGTHYMDISAVQSPFSIGRDGNERHLVSVNFDVRKRVTGIAGDPGAFAEGFSGGFD